MKNPNPVVAILSSDWHISHKPPLARSAEDSWYTAMDRVLRQIADLCYEHKAPLVIAGDLFDTPNQPAEVVNWLMSRLVDIPTFAIPGQHDLPFHNYADRRKSAYWTLVEAGRIKNLAPRRPVEFGTCRLHGFPFGYPVRPLKKRHSLVTEIAVVHSYCWIPGTEHADAEESTNLKSYLKDCLGYDIIVFGDNHTFWKKELRDGR